MCKRIVYGKDITYKVDIISNKYLSLIKNFSCDNKEIDNYLQNKAMQDNEFGNGVTKLFLNESETEVIAYYTLNCCSMVIEQYHKNYFAPAVEIKMFAVNKKYQKLSYSEKKEDGVFSDFILCKIISEINNFTEYQCGANRIVLYAVKNALEFYGDIGFEDFTDIMKKDNDLYLDECTPMFLNL